MLIAQAKRKENIAEYILYLWQLEDLLRALCFDPDAIWRTLVETHDTDPATRQEMLLWYMELVNLLREEGKAESGHLRHTMHLVEDLQGLHNRLMALPGGAGGAGSARATGAAVAGYRAAFARLSPELPTLRTILGRNDAGEIELCFRALYSVVLYRVKSQAKGEAQPRAAIAGVLELVSPVVATLVAIYHKIERGEMDLELD